MIFVAFGLYFAIILAVGLLSRNKSHTAAEFIMGNRSLNFWVTAISAHASDMSSWLFMGLPMAVLVGGMSQTWIAFGLLLGMFCNWHIVAPRLRVATEKYNSYTLSTFFEKRFEEDSGLIRLLSALMTLVFMTIYLSSGLIAMGLLFESIFGVDYYVGIFVATAVVVAYTFLGGFVTVAWTDLFQGIFLLAMIVMVPIVAFMKTGGIAAIAAGAEKFDISMSLLRDTSFGSLFTALSLSVGWGIGYFGQPHILTKFMGIKSAGDLYKAKYLGFTWQLLALTAAISVGLIGLAFFPDGLKEPQLVFVEMVKALFNPLAAGFVLCAIFAATMSTMDSMILVCASVLTEDLYKRFARSTPASHQLLNVSRISVIVVACVALLFSLNKSKTIMDIVSYAWSGLGCSFGPVLLMALYSKTTNKYGAIAGIAIGGLISGLWPTLNDYFFDFNVPAMFPGFILSLLSIRLVSALTRKQSLPVRLL